MNKKITIWSELNEIGFCVIVGDADYVKAKKLAQKGFDMWNDPDNYPKYHDVGYAEPAEKLLKEAGIKYKLRDIEPYSDEAYICRGIMEHESMKELEELSKKAGISWDNPFNFLR